MIFKRLFLSLILITSVSTLYAYDWEQQQKDRAMYESRQQLWQNIREANRSNTTNVTDYAYALDGIKDPEKERRDWELQQD